MLSLPLCLLLAGSLAAQDLKMPADKDIQTTESGLKYSVLCKGSKGPHPRMGQTVKVHYTGWFTDGKIFDSSVQRGEPAIFKLGQVIQGWNEGLQLMTPGAKFKFTIPGHLAYGPKGRGKIPANATLIFEVHLLEVWVPPVFRKGNPAAQKTTPSGIKYEVLMPGNGNKPGKDDVFEMKYAFWDVKGKLLDCTENQGHTIKGSTKHMGLGFLKEAPLLLSPGARYRFEIPAALCFKDEAKGSLPPNSVTIWELEMVRFIKPLPVPAFSLSPKEKLKTTDSGLQYEVIKEGTGKSPKLGSPVTVHYAGWLENGTNFDSSYSRGEPSTFQLGRVIQGWNEGLQLMKEGAVFKFTIPGNLAYGDRGSPPKIGPNATLIFHVTLIKVK